MTDTNLRETLAGLRDKWRKSANKSNRHLNVTNPLDEPEWATELETNMRDLRMCADELEAALAAHPAGVEPAMMPVPIPNAGDIDGQSLIDMNNLAVGYGVPNYQPGVAAPQPIQQAGERDSFTLVPNSALRWLFGEAGDFVSPADAYKRPYWWRTEFRKRIAAQPATPGSEGE